MPQHLCSMTTVQCICGSQTMSHESNSSSVSRGYFEQYVEVAAELLGEDDSCTKSLRAMFARNASDAIDRGMALIRALPTMQRDHILLHGKNRANENEIGRASCRERV